MRIPTIHYGTAWKEDRTEGLVREAIHEGFRGIDTANQRKHYHEAGVGAALQHAFREGGIAREDLFVQTKFTYVRGQDHRLPYDPRAPLATQVAQSFTSSLAHLGVEIIDSYVLHGPSVASGLAPDDIETWRAMEALHDDGRARILGISNVAPDQLALLYEKARVKPALVQNRTFTRPLADAAVRAFCRERQIAYQGFSLLTAIPQIVAHPEVRAIAVEQSLTPAQVIFAWCRAQNILILTGTTRKQHMADDLAITRFALTEENVAALSRLLMPGARA